MEPALLCRSCRGSKGWKRLRRDLRAVGDVELVRCQSICDGPVVGVVVAGRLEWFRRVRGRARRRALVRLAAGRPGIPDRLLRRRVAGRSGRRR